MCPSFFYANVHALVKVMRTMMMDTVMTRCEAKACEYKMSTVPTKKCVGLTLLETLLSSCANMFPCYKASSYRL